MWECVSFSKLWLAQETKCVFPFFGFSTFHFRTSAKPQSEAVKTFPHMSSLRHKRDVGGNSIAWHEGIETAAWNIDLNTIFQMGVDDGLFLRSKVKCWMFGKTIWQENIFWKQSHTGQRGHSLGLCNLFCRRHFCCCIHSINNNTERIWEMDGFDNMLDIMRPIYSWW